MNAREITRRPMHAASDAIAQARSLAAANPGKRYQVRASISGRILYQSHPEPESVT